MVVDTWLGGNAVCLIGIESKPVPWAGFPPSDGRTATPRPRCFPRSSKKVARTINAAFGDRPVAILANLSGFDGSPESMRNLRLKYGAEITLNTVGPSKSTVAPPISKRLNPRLTVLAVEGSYASLLGGTPAAAVVFAPEVAKRAAADPRIAEPEQRIANGPQRGRRRRAQHPARAVGVGSVYEVIAASELRPKIISAIERGLTTRLARLGGARQCARVAS